MAEAELRRLGWKVVDRNVTMAGGEIDLVADPGDEVPTIVFVEVRTRSGDERGHPIETVDRRKRAQIIRVAKAWLVARDLWDRVAVRFDVVTISKGALEHFEDAFRDE